MNDCPPGIIPAGFEDVDTVTLRKFRHFAIFREDNFRPELQPRRRSGNYCVCRVPKMKLRQSSDVMLEVEFCAFVCDTLAVGTGLRRSGFSVVWRSIVVQVTCPRQGSNGAPALRNSPMYGMVLHRYVIWWYATRVYDGTQRSITVRAGSVTSKMQPVCVLGGGV